MHKVFIAGPIKIKTLDETVVNTLQAIIRNNLNILIGDAGGLDREVQHYLMENKYRNVTVYCINKPRNNIGNWPVRTVTSGEEKITFSEYIKKDKKMADETDFGFMIWNGKSNGTLNNILNLLEQSKKLKLCFTPLKKLYKIENISDLEAVLKLCSREDLEKTDKKIKLFSRMDALSRGDLFRKKKEAFVGESSEDYSGF